MTPTTTPIRIVGLTGKLGSGKDTVLLRLQELFGDRYEKASYAEPLKKSVAALFNITVEQIEAMKNEPQIRVTIVDLKGAGRDLGRSFSMREILQRYGTEAHREVFGEDFWVAAAMADLARRDPDPEKIYVFTDVRFDNEAKAIVNAGGRVYRVIGADNNTGDHPSEAGVSELLISGTIDNSHRPDLSEMQNGRFDNIANVRNEALSSLDDEVAKLHAELTR